jgi:hypothetical protein
MKSEVRRQRTAFCLLPTAYCLLFYADPLYRSAAHHVNQRALASEASVHAVITDVKYKMRVHTEAGSADLF